MFRSEDEGPVPLAELRRIRRHKKFLSHTKTAPTPGGFLTTFEKYGKMEKYIPNTGTMTTEKSPEASAPLPGSEGLKPFAWNGINKFDLQTANDLFEELAKDPKNPQVLGKINALKIDIMKRAAEAEIAKLTPVRNRSQIEAEMKERNVSKNQANDELAYVLVTYLQNVEKLAAERETAKAAVTAEAGKASAKLKAEVAAPAPKSETVVVDKAAKPEPKVSEKEASNEELKSAKFIKEHRAEIDALVAKMPEGNAKSTFPGLLDKPTKENVTVLQAEIGLKAGVKGGADGQFGAITLGALKKYAEAGGKKPAEAGKKPDGKTGDKPAEAGKKPSTAEKPKTKKEKEEEAKKAEEAKKKEEEAAAKKKAEAEAAEKSAKEKELDALQKKTLANLKPEGNGVYVVDTKLFKDGFAGAVFFKFDAKNGEWLWNSFNNPDEMKSSSWHKVSGLEQSTAGGVTKLSGFSFNESTQETVNAILAAQKRSKEVGIPLKDPNAPSPIVNNIPR